MLLRIIINNVGTWYRSIREWAMIWIKYHRENMEERVAEICHRLVVERACGGSGCAPEFLDREEELLDELRGLERDLDLESNEEQRSSATLLGKRTL